MEIAFTKCECCGNDYVYIDSGSPVFRESISKTALITDDKFFKKLTVSLSDRRFGIGSDGAVFYKFPAEKAEYDLEIRMYNSDGSEGLLCGTALRSAACILDEKLAKSGLQKNSYKIKTASGIKMVKKDDLFGFIAEIGKADFSAGEKFSILKKPVINYAFCCGVSLTLLSVGNLHAVAFIDDIKNFDLENFYKTVKRSKIFTAPFNLEIAKVTSDNSLLTRVYENGSGETLCCGTGACAVAAAAVILKKITSKKINVTFNGGTVLVNCDQSYNLSVGGNVKKVFTGVYYYEP